MPRQVTWSYGVTTVMSRVEELLPRTLVSLGLAGFSSPRIFLDGGLTHDADNLERRLGLEVTARHPQVRAFNNWIMALWELYAREPTADRYVIFQDDLVTCRNLRSYLDALDIPTDGNYGPEGSGYGYWNLYTAPIVEDRFPVEEVGFRLSPQTFQGALALVFDRRAVQALLGDEGIIQRPTDPQNGWRNLDGAIGAALGRAGIQEYIHMPSLIQHTGNGRSTINKFPHPISRTFVGETFDARELLRCSGTPLRLRSKELV